MKVHNGEAFWWDGYWRRNYLWVNLYDVDLRKNISRPLSAFNIHNPEGCPHATIEGPIDPGDRIQYKGALYEVVRPMGREYTIFVRNISESLPILFNKGASDESS